MLDHDIFSNVEKIEELKEGVIYVMENLNFLPDEHAYVSPWIDPEEEEKKNQQAEVKEDAEEGVGSGKVAPPAKDPKKMSAAEKKKAEEEAKRKAEEESKAADALAASAES